MSPVKEVPKQLQDYPLAELILKELERQMPFLRRAASETPLVSLEERLPTLELIVQRLSSIHGSPEKWIPEVVRSYVMLSMEFLMLQRRLEETGRYLLSTEREAQERVYHNKDVFGGYYLSGLLLSEALWPNHYQLGVFYKDIFLPLLEPKAAVLEVGVGSGYHLYHLFDCCPEVNYFGVDVSSYAIDFCQKFASGRLGRCPNARFQNRDVMLGLEEADESYDAIILGEILEHVERPDKLLNEMARVAKPRAPMFMTTVIFAANIDHIYLFENAEEIRKLLGESSWVIEKEWILPIYPEDRPEMAKKPMNYGSILRKR